MSDHFGTLWITGLKLGRISYSAKINGLSKIYNISIESIPVGIFGTSCFLKIIFKLLKVILT